MANTTYQTPVINTPAKEDAALDKLQELINHVRQSALNGYPAHIFSIVFDQGGTNRITVILSGPLPNQAQTDRYNFTLVP